MLGRYFEQIRERKYDDDLVAEQQLNPEQLSKTKLIEKSQKQKPQCVFLEGGNGLKTQAEAVKNKRCGLIVVHKN